jgi:FAD dependent oxidoreductase
MRKTRVAIIGAGWVGCHLANSLKPNADVDVFDESGIFAGASYYNQNRLHMGFHYARNYQTRQLCKTTFDKFIELYPFLVRNLDLNIYSIPINRSILDLTTYLAIFDHDQIPYTRINCESLIEIEGSIKNSESLIDHQLAKEHFTEMLQNRLTIRRITGDDIGELLLSYDFVINCTNNLIKDPSTSAYHELSLSLVYRKIGQTDFDALTVVDGNFFSIFPYMDDLYTLTSVHHTPIYVSDSPIDVIGQADQLSQARVFEIRESCVDLVSKYYPDFLKNFEYVKYFTSIKSKIVSESANRYPIISTDDRLINCFTGKIQGIFAIEEEVKKYINFYESSNR